MLNPVPFRYVEMNPELTAIYDAFETGDPRALELCVGLPCTISVGSDRYAGTIKRITSTTIIAEMSPYEEVTFRAVRGAWRARQRSHRMLAVGVAESYRDPSF